MPATWVPPYFFTRAWELHRKPAPASAVVLVQEASLDPRSWHPPPCTCSGLAPPASHLHTPNPTLIHGLYCCAHNQRETVQPWENMPNCKWIKVSNQKAQTGWMGEKTRPTLCCLQETHFSFKDTYRLKVKESKRYSMQMETKREKW